MRYPKRTQYKYSKSRYRVRNWAAYDAGLRRRGDLTIWFSEEAINAWTAPRRTKPGGQRVYSNLAIETALTVRLVYGLPLRQTEGFLGSIADLLSLSIPIPDHTTLSRRGKKLGKLPILGSSKGGPLHLLIDSTGLRIHVGHRTPPKTRAWRKLHVGVDAKTGDIVAADVTASRARDASRVPALLKQIERPLSSASADAAYDNEDVYAALEEHADDRSPRVLIAPKKNAKVNGTARILRERNRNIRSRKRLGNREWHKRSGYSRRSLVENAVYRHKAIIGREMWARSLAGQRVEARIGVKILNRMRALGMPDSCKVG